MIYLLDGAYDVNRTDWCDENDIFYITMAKTFIPLMVCFSDKKFDDWMHKIIIFNSANAMAFKLRWC